MTPRMRLPLISAAALIAVLSFGGCSSSDDDGGKDSGDSASPSSIAASKVEEEVKAELTELAGVAPDDVACVDLPAEVDASIRCTVSRDGEEIGATVTVTSVDGGDVEFDIQVDEASPGADPSSGATGAAVPAADVAEQAKQQLAASVGQEPDDVTCVDDLPAEVGATIRCTLTDAGTQYGVTVTATEVDGTNVKFDVQVDQEPMTP
ncbi:DUF4333 domain-containing protein [Nocardioides sp. GXZ039]|uniref:DUF4333 domain-containing protein n=1 Tax=Nocardioides sp. GXZ039 TaxID=3136018 RepID=UPI0030F39F37